MSSNTVSYFIFSQKQYDQRMQIESDLGRTPSFGMVIVSGSPKIYTDIITDISNCRYTDRIIITSGDISKIKYTSPVW